MAEENDGIMYKDKFFWNSTYVKTILNIKSNQTLNFGSQSGLMSIREMAVIADIIYLKKPKAILEIGHYCGFSTVCIATVIEDISKIYNGYKVIFDTVDFHEDDSVVRANYKDKSTKDIFQENIKNVPFLHKIHQDGNFRVHNCTFQDFFKKSEQQYDFVYYDAEHRYEVQEAFFKLVLPRLEIGGILVIDDIDLWGGPIIDKEIMNSGLFRKLCTPVIRLKGDKTNPFTFSEGIYLRIK